MAQQGEHFDPAFFAELAKYEERNFWFRARNAIILTILRQHVPQLNSYLEIGCGTGYVLKGVGEVFPQATCVGTELFVEALPIAAERNPEAKLVQMDARSIPYRKAFDVVGAFDVLEHIKEDDEVIANMFAAVRPGGYLLATVPQHRFLWSAADDVAHHVRRYARKELQSKLRAAGFSIVRSTSFMSLLLPAMALSRLVIKPTERVDPMAEFRIPRWLNAIFGAVLGLERVAVTCGMNFPFGGSRLVLGRRPP